MSWIRTTSNQILNLDAVASLTVSELEEPEGGRDVDDSTHGVFANDLEGESWLLADGSEEYCNAKLEQITAKLPMVKP